MAVQEAWRVTGGSFPAQHATRIAAAISAPPCGHLGFNVKMAGGQNAADKDSAMQVTLADLAYARSGDKGDGSNVGVVAYNQAGFAFLQQVLTPERVKQHFGQICLGKVERFEAPNLLALNFILHDSLGGGGSESLKTDAQGKTHGLGMLQLVLDAPEDLLPSSARSV
jgi:hypothetical protein